MQKKGITPIIAIVLLLLMTVVVSGATYLWMKQVQGDLQTGVGEGITQQTESLQSGLSVDSIWEDATFVIFMLRNINAYTYTTDDISKFAYYLDDSALGVLTCSGLSETGTTCEVNSGVVFPAAGTTFNLKIVDNFGNEVVKSCKVDALATGCE